MNTLLFIMFLTASLGVLLAIALTGAWLVRVARYRNSIEMANSANEPNVGIHENGKMTMYAEAAIATRFFLVKAGTTAWNYCAASASATDEVIGVCEDEAKAAGDPVTVALFGAVKGTVRMVAAGVINQWDYVQSNGDGKIKTHTTGGFICGRTVQAAGADGDVIEVIPMVSHAAI